jgi:hypothetical protein
MNKAIAVVVLAFSIVACTDRSANPTGLTSLDELAAARVGPPGPCCYEDGRVLRTTVPPSAFPNEGVDPLYAFTGAAADGQLAVIAAGPGDSDYHGGAWAFHSVTWNVTPYLITSDEQLAAAAAAGDVTITRVAANDFRCPVQP